MTSGYRNNVSQYMREEIHIITKELQERVTFDNRNSTHPSHSSEHTWVSYDHRESHIIEHRSNNVQTTHNNDTNISYKSHHQNLVNSFDGKNLSDDSHQETPNNTLSDFQCEEFIFKDLIHYSEYESDDHVDPEISVENSENSEDHISLHDDYQYSENAEDYYAEDSYEYSEDSEDYYYDDNDVDD